MWPGFKSRTWRHIWVEFVVGSFPCSEGFSPGSQHFNSNLIWDPSFTGLSVTKLLRWLNIVFVFCSALYISFCLRLAEKLRRTSSNLPHSILVLRRKLFHCSSVHSAERKLSFMKRCCKHIIKLNSIPVFYNSELSILPHAKSKGTKKIEQIKPSRKY